MGFWTSQRVLMMFYSAILGEIIVGSPLKCVIGCIK